MSLYNWHLSSGHVPRRLRVVAASASHGWKRVIPLDLLFRAFLRLLARALVSELSLDLYLYLSESLQLQLVLLLVVVAFSELLIVLPL